MKFISKALIAVVLFTFTLNLSLHAQGFSWTTKDPRSVSNFRNAAGLPSGGASGANNSADFLIQGRARVSNILESRSALPLDGNSGGLSELIIDPNNVDLINFSVIRP